MFEPRPPRREPRVFLIARARGQLAYLVIDAWDFVAIGRLPKGAMELRAITFTRRLLQTRPTVVAALGLHEETVRSLESTGRRHGVPLLRLDSGSRRALSLHVPTLESAFKEYPIARALDPVLVHPLLPLAIAALHHLAFPHRSYASRQSTRSAPDMDLASARRHCPS